MLCPITTSSTAAALATAPAAVVPDDMIVAQLLGMDIPMNAAQRAAIAVDNASADAALDWVRLSFQAQFTLLQLQFLIVVVVESVTSCLKSTFNVRLCCI
jgi:hypothetical protein